MSAAIQITPEEREFLRDALRNATVGRDCLPYTSEFNTIHRDFKLHFQRSLSRLEFWRILASVAKQKGGLGGTTVKKKRQAAPRLRSVEEIAILSYFPSGLGPRDRLPYTKTIDDLRNRFERETGRSLTRHEFWLSVLRLAKQGRIKLHRLQDRLSSGFGLELLSTFKDLTSVVQATNPWWENGMPVSFPFYRRKLHAGILSELKDRNGKQCVIVRGPRQVGKTTLQQQVIAELLLNQNCDPLQIMRIQFDQLRGLASIKDPLVHLVLQHKRLLADNQAEPVASQEPWFFLDEVQNVENWSGQLKFLVDNVPGHYFVTGSSSLQISRSKDSLANRARWLEAGPFSLSEIAGLHRIPPFLEQRMEPCDLKSIDYWVSLSSNANQAEVRKAFRLFSERGGFPFCHTSEENSQSAPIRELIQEVVVRGTIQHEYLRESRLSLTPGILDAVFRIVCRYAGCDIKPRNISQELARIHGDKFASPKTVDQILEYLEDMMLLRRIPTMEAFGAKAKEGPKLCLCDHMIRDAVLMERVPLTPEELAKAPQEMAALAGHLIESILGYAFAAIRPIEVAWLPARKGRPEVDFVLTIGDQRIPIEVKYRRRDPNESDLAGIRNFCNRPEMRSPFGIIVTQDFAGRIDDQVVAIPADLMLSIF